MGPSGLSLSTLWLLLNVFIIHVAFVSCSHRNETDRLSLLAFKDRVTHDPLRVLSSWNVSVHHCQWLGVTCEHRHQRVIILDLMSQKLVGSITSQVGNLSFLRALYLQNNSFTGFIPSELGRLRRLRYLRLNNNSMTGVIPANISSCSNLVVFDLGFNKLEGEIPMEISSLSKLEQLYIANNKLTREIPPPLGNLSSLKYISVGNNILSGSIPDALGKLKCLTRFVIENNMLTGTLPPSIFNLSSIEFFFLSFNQIQGSLPSNLGITMPDLKMFKIAFNKFTGSIPVSLSNATDLVKLILQGNELIGKVPNFRELHKLEWLNIATNLLGAKEADDLSFFSSLTNASNLYLLALGHNNLGGILPESVSNLSTTMHMLSLYRNHIYGTIPRGLANLIHLQRLNARGNLFTGEHPFYPRGMQKFVIDGLSRNNLWGKIPLKVLGISSLSIALDLSDNHLSGSLPTEIGSLKNLGVLDISRNMLSGKIPSTLGICLSLEILSMEGNNFQGIIPSSFGTLRGLRRLDLSTNNLSGPIPHYLEGFDLQYLNLSFNDFDGAVPSEGIFKNKSVVFINGNDKLCGGAPELGLSRCNIERSKKRKLTLTLKLSISITSGVAGLSLLLCLLFFYWSKRTKKESSLDSPEKSNLKVSYQILLKATDGFSWANMIGAGSFGSVYKGVLNDSETIVAVKVLNLLCKGAFKSFVAECEALRNIRHRNLVKVITACSGVDYQGNDFKALVYEFMANGSLEKWLHPGPNDDEILEKLNFLQRLNVAIDVACALEYLHHGCPTPIIHCDLKPSNVLLDNEMISYVADFGLAKFIEEATSNSSADQASSVGIRGTIGYTAPEYGMGSKVSTHGNVYSYGILVLEMFTGKRPTDEMFKDKDNLHNYAKTALSNQVVEIADPIILQEIEENNARAESCSRRNKVEESLISIIRIGVACSAELARERMNMSDVAAQLHSIRDNFLGNGTQASRDYKCTPTWG